MFRPARLLLLQRSCLRLLKKIHSLPTMSEGKIVSSDFSALLTPSLLHLENLFKSAGYDFRLVGGVVRDLLLGVTPKDIDIGTDCKPEEMMDLLQSARIKYVPTGLKHGTVTVVKGGASYEITTLRVDKVTDGRRADVVFVNDWKLDALRRDLTINAMSLSLDGTLYDYFNGEQHLAEKRVLFVGDPHARIREDYLRILRYFRFYGRIVPEAGHHDAKTLEAIRELMEGLRMISVERIWSEMGRILVGNHAPHLIQLMYELGVARHIKLPYDGNLSELEKVWRAMRDRKTDHQLRPVSFLVALTRSGEEFHNLATTWKLTNKDRDMGVFLAQHREVTYDPSTPVKYYQDLLVEGAKLDFVLELFGYCNRLEYCSHLEGWAVPTLPVNGKDLRELAGVQPGRGMGCILKRLKGRWMESGFKLSKEELLEMVGEVSEGEEGEREGDSASSNSSIREAQQKRRKLQ